MTLSCKIINLIRLNFLDNSYQEAGAELVEKENNQVKKIVDIVLCVQPPDEKFLLHLKPGSFLVGLLDPYGNSSLGEILGTIIAPLVMALVYFVILTPVSFIVRISGKDLLGLKFLKEKETYWIKRKKNLGSMKRQF